MFFSTWTLYDWGMAVTYIVVPILAMWVTQKYSFLMKIGAMMICFFLGLIFGNIFPTPETHLEVRSLFTTVTIPLAIPLVLMGTDFKHWVKTSGLKSVWGFICSALAAAVSGFTMVLLLKNILPEAHKMAGSLIGGLTGATFNAVAVAQAADMSQGTLTMMMSSMLVYEIPWMIFMVTCAKQVVGKFLLPYKDNVSYLSKGQRKATGQISSVKTSDWDSQLAAAKQASSEDTSEWGGFLRIFTEKNLLPCLSMFVLTVAIYFVCKGFSLLFDPGARSTVVIIGSSIFGILCSLIGPFRKIKGTYNLGIYVVMIFAFPLTAGADLRTFLDPSMVYIFLFCCGMLYLTLLLSVIFCKIAKIDTDTMLSTHAGAVFSPGYVPVVVTHLKNPKVLISGVASGIFGYAIGSFLGIIFTRIFSLL
jgi:uncharacterized membrane protein